MKRKKEKSIEADVVIPNNLANPLEEYEIEVAWILAKHYNCAVRFLVAIDGYMVKTPDMVMRGVMWEMKSPCGNSKTTISNNLKNAKKQSASIIFDNRRMKMSDPKIQADLMRELVKRKYISRLIMITKDEKVVEIRM
ncbi:MAG: hypothetical protein LBN22_01260 [Clostridiales Family XIII bacterium]|jgi:hypothetical protein|nr:hypothetical protein [Clostridiales Family XIII bacterium]